MYSQKKIKYMHYFIDLSRVKILRTKLIFFQRVSCWSVNSAQTMINAPSYCAIQLVGSRKMMI